MKQLKIAAVIAVFALLLPLTALAKNTTKGSMDLSSSAQVAGTQLKPGNYTVEWNGSGSNAQVKFIHDGKTVATTSGSVVQLKNRAPYDEVVMSSKRGQNVIDEIDFGSKTTALRFGTTGQPGQ